MVNILGHFSLLFCNKFLQGLRNIAAILWLLVIGLWFYSCVKSWYYCTYTLNIVTENLICSKLEAFLWLYSFYWLALYYDFKGTFCDRKGILTFFVSYFKICPNFTNTGVKICQSWYCVLVAVLDHYHNFQNLIKILKCIPRWTDLQELFEYISVWQGNCMEVKEHISLWEKLDKNKICYYNVQRMKAREGGVHFLKCLVRSGGMVTGF